MTMAVAGRMTRKLVARIAPGTHVRRDEASRGKGGFVFEGSGSTVGRAGRLSDHT